MGIVKSQATYVYNYNNNRLLQSSSESEIVQSVVKKSRVPGKDRYVHDRYVHAGEFGLTLHDDVSIFVDLCFLHLTVRLGHHQLKSLNVLLVLIVSCQISKEQLLLI